MNLLLVFASGLFLVTAFPGSQLFKRDVSHLDLSYIPPQIPPVEKKEHQPSEILLISPSNGYIPPVAALKGIPVFSENPRVSTNPTASSEAAFKIETLAPTNEYLPSAADIKESLEVITEESNLPTNEYLPPIHIGEDISEIPLEPFLENNESTEIEDKALVGNIKEESSGEVVESQNLIPEDTTVKKSDGYHYNKPDNIPDLFIPIEVNTEYLPPQANRVVDVEGQENAKSAVLQNDGYHYRSIERRF